MTEPAAPVPTPTTSRAATFKLVRDIVLFAVGVGGIIWEVLANGGQNSTLLVMFSGMAGLPAFLFGDARRTQAAAAAQPPPPQPPPPA